MRPQQQNKRMRGRGRKGPNPLARSYESNGPDVKIRGTAQHIAEKYTTLARDATASGDRVMAENYLQHAEHYGRIVAAAQGSFQLQSAERDYDGDEDEGDDLPAEGSAPNGQQNNGQQNNGQQHNGFNGDRQHNGGERQNNGQNRHDGGRSDNPRHDGNRDRDRRNNFRDRQGNGEGYPSEAVAEGDDGQNRQNGNRTDNNNRNDGSFRRDRDDRRTRFAERRERFNRERGDGQVGDGQDVGAVGAPQPEIDSPAFADDAATTPSVEVKAEQGRRRGRPRRDDDEATAGVDAPVNAEVPAPAAGESPATSSADAIDAADADAKPTPRRRTRAAAKVEGEDAGSEAPKRKPATRARRKKSDDDVSEENRLPAFLVGSDN